VRITDADGRAGVNRQVDADMAWTLVFCAWLLAAASTLGALFFGEVMRLPPCSLCWYQRIFMFPMALVLPFGLFPFDRNVVRSTLPWPCLAGWSPPFMCCSSPG